VRVKVELKGQLYWYDKENRKQIELEANDIKTPIDILRMLGVPPSEVQMVISNDKKIDLKDEIKDGDVITFMPVISGG
jgi:molybdopterin converting factor small subunit